MSLPNALRAALLLSILSACTASAPMERAPEPASDLIACPSPRPQICTFDYRPVCAQRDTGVRCVTTPCPSTEAVTRSNACSACSDPKVLGYRTGECR